MKIFTKKRTLKGLIFIGSATIFSLMFGLLILRQKIFVESNEIKQISAKISDLKIKDLALVAKLNQLESPQVLKTLFQNNFKNSTCVIVQVKNWEDYKGTSLDRQNLALNIVKKKAF